MLGLSVLVGLWRGFVFEIVSLLGWVVAFVIANSLGPLLAHFIRWATRLPGAAVGGLRPRFRAGAGHLHAAGAHAAGAVSATPLSLVDRLLGGLFGVVRGA